MRRSPIARRLPSLLLVALALGACDDERPAAGAGITAGKRLADRPADRSAARVAAEPRDTVPAAQLVARGDTAATAERPLEIVQGDATYYGTKLDGQRTASGERLDAEELVGAHPGWPFGTMARVTATGTGRQVTVRIIDRGPARRHLAEGVVIDLSVGAARALGMREDGQVPVRVEVLRWGSGERVAPGGTAR